MTRSGHFLRDHARARQFYTFLASCTAHLRIPGRSGMHPCGTGGAPLARATSISERTEPLRLCTSPTTRLSRSCPCNMVSMAVEKRAKSLSLGTPPPARRPRIRFTSAGVKPSLLPTTRPLFQARRLVAILFFEAIYFRSHELIKPLPLILKLADTPTAL